ncbi:hypothetical protein PAUR_a3099 [Pseudoalteromonas aurantia 208]|uniref:Uncharacterized protein n=1 Tax=Pseudoalteromonas aurantia 208 TaxID=1314867 RepID=A0ABR9EE74_9GAMM|nr:hypothetical protein [Pseudoalteromonas aurantia 208]
MLKNKSAFEGVKKCDYVRSWPTGCIAYNSEIIQLATNHYLDTKHSSLARYGHGKRVFKYNLDEVPIAISDNYVVNTNLGFWEGVLFFCKFFLIAPIAV